MRLQLHRRCNICVVIAQCCVLSALAAEPLPTSGTTEPAVLSTLVPPAGWEASRDEVLQAPVVPEPADGRDKLDAPRTAVLRPILGSSNDMSPVRPATALTADRLDNNVCMVVKTTGPERVCKVSPSGRFKLCLQRDANIVLYDGATAYWASNTHGTSKLLLLPLRLCVQPDGFLVAYDSADRVFWASDASRQRRPTPITAFIQDDGNLVIYDGTCAAIWASKSVAAAPVRPPCSAAGSPQRVVLRDRAPTTGPFGEGDPKNNPAAFNDASFAANGANRITQVDVRAGGWIDAIRFTYGTTAAPWHGGNGGGPKPSFRLRANEWITQAWVVSGGYVDEIRFFTNTGRYWSTSGDTSQSGKMGMLASPCPANAYRLVSIKGVSETYLERIEFVWAMVARPPRPLVSTVNLWSYLPGNSPAFRIGSTGQPQCLSSDGVNCATSTDGFNLRMCADTLSARPVTCAVLDGADDQLHWCNKARGALGLPAPPVPIRAAFFIVEICDSGRAATSSDVLNTVYNDPHGLKAYWAKASNGRAYLDESTSAIINLRLPCDKFPITSCNVDDWVDYSANNPDALGGRVLSQYQFQSFIAPDTAACTEGNVIGWAYGTISASVFADPSTVKHEMGHNFGLNHGSQFVPPKQVLEYDDFTTPMGDCSQCIYNSVEQLQLGWSRALPVIDWAAFTGSAVLVLPALSDVAAFTDLGVYQIRLQSPKERRVPGGVARTLHLSYRVAKNQDAGLPAQFSQATSVHAERGNSWLLAWPRTGEAYVNAANKMVVRQDSGDSNEAMITLCKWVSTATECGAFKIFVRPSNSAVSAKQASVGLHAHHVKRNCTGGGFKATTRVEATAP